MARAAAETEAANGALAEIGEPPLASLDEPRAAARACKQRFHDVRDALLREYDFNFSTAYVVPAQITGDALGTLKRRYALPPDCARVRSVEGLGPDEWAIEASSVGAMDTPLLASVLVCNVVGPRVCYSRIVAQPVLWDALFLQVFQLRLGAAVARLIGRSETLADRLSARADVAIRRAKRRDAQEKASTRLPQHTSWLQARFGGRPR